MPFTLGERDEAGHFIPEPEQQPISDEREGDVWYELRELTFEEQPGSIFVATHEVEVDPRGLDARGQFLRRLEKEETMEGRVCFLPNLTLTTQIRKEGKTVTKKERLPWNLGIKECADEVIRRCSLHRGKDVEPLLALVLWQADYYEMHRGVDYLKYLPLVKSKCPDLPIYLFHDYHIGKYGVEREGRAVGSLWDTQSEMTDEKELQAVIEHIANQGESTWIFAPPKHGKTWVMLCIVKALLTGKPLFDVPHLQVPTPSQRVIYLCPEASRTSLRKRLKMLGLIEHLYDSNTNPEGRLYVRSLSKGPKLNLDDAELLKLANNADIFIDTAIRYLEGNENDAGDVKQMTEKSLNLLAVGARSTWVAHHSGKQFASATEMTLENCSRGSTEFTAALTNAIGMCQLDKDKNLIHFHFIDGRDMDEPAADMQLQGRPYLSQVGNFQVTENVERFKGRNNKSGPKDLDRQAKIDFAKSLDDGSRSIQDIRIEVNNRFGTSHVKSTIGEWLEPFKGEASKA